LSADRLILAAGGASYPALGSNASGFELARHLGHTIIAPVPAAVPLVVKDKLCHLLQGQKLGVYVKVLHRRELVAESAGELLFTQYGLSGTAALDVSREISVVLNRHAGGDIILVVDLVPWMSEGDLAAELQRKTAAGYQPQELLIGILSNKIARAVAPGEGAVSAADLAHALKTRHFAVSGTRGWNEAEFTAGGVDISEVDPATLGSRRCPGLYLCGEVLDVDGCRGGHNLAWAWASGLLAGSAAAS
jgi:predicted Rossmann fold flavoprotein